MGLIPPGQAGGYLADSRMSRMPRLPRDAMLITETSQDRPSGTRRTVQPWWPSGTE